MVGSCVFFCITHDCARLCERARERYLQAISCSCSSSLSRAPPRALTVWGAVPECSASILQAIDAAAATISFHRRCRRCQKDFLNCVDQVCFWYVAHWLPVINIFSCRGSGGSRVVVGCRRARKRQRWAEIERKRETGRENVKSLSVARM